MGLGGNQRLHAYTQLMMEPKWRRRIQHMWQPIGKQRTHLNTDFSQRLSIIAKAHKQIPINRPSRRYVICIYLSRWLDPCAIICCCVSRWLDPCAIFAVVYILVLGSSSPPSGGAAIMAAMEGEEDFWTITYHRVNLLDGMCFNIQ